MIILQSLKIVYKNLLDIMYMNEVIIHHHHYIHKSSNNKKNKKKNEDNLTKEEIQKHIAENIKQLKALYNNLPQNYKNGLNLSYIVDGES